MINQPECNLTRNSHSTFIFSPHLVLNKKMESKGTKALILLLFLLFTKISIPQIFCRVAVLKKLAKLTGKTQIFLCEILRFLITAFYRTIPDDCAKHFWNSDLRSSRPEVFCKKRRSLKLCKIHRKTPAPESLF